jgi:hypothetical protein
MREWGTAPKIEDRRSGLERRLHRRLSGGAAAVRVVARHSDDVRQRMTAVPRKKLLCNRYPNGSFDLDRLREDAMFPKSPMLVLAIIAGLLFSLVSFGGAQGPTPEPSPTTHVPIAMP